MKVLSQAPAHLSNFEVLTHFVSLKKDTDLLETHRANHALRNKVAMREKYALTKERDEPPDGSRLPAMNDKVRKLEDEADRRGSSEWLNWVQNEVIRYLCSDLAPTARQTADGVTELADQLQDHRLTKSEVLQIVNLAPVLPVELYAIIEDVDNRFQPDASGRLEHIAAHVQSTLLPEAPKNLHRFVTHVGSADAPAAADQGGDGTTERMDMDDEEAYMQQEYVTEVEYGEGYEAGVEEGDKTGEIDT